MDTSGEKIIALSRKKLVLIVLGSCAFVAAGIWMVSSASSLMDQAMGWLSIAFFGAIPFFAVPKMFDRRPGLVLNSVGILDNSSAVAAGLIPWSEIRGFSIYEFEKTRSLMILVRDPEKYIGRGNAVKRALHRANLGMCGSPLAITSSALQIGFDELHQTCEAYLGRYGSAPAPS